MKVNYVLQLNLMTPGPDDCRTVVVNRTNYSIMEFYKHPEFLRQTGSISTDNFK